MAGGQVAKVLDCKLQGCWFKSHHAIGYFLPFLGGRPILSLPYKMSRCTYCYLDGGCKAVAPGVLVSISIQLLVPITFTQHGGFMNREEKVVNAGGVDVYNSIGWFCHAPVL